MAAGFAPGRWPAGGQLVESLGMVARHSNASGALTVIVLTIGTVRPHAGQVSGRIGPSLPMTTVSAELQPRHVGHVEGGQT
jgi:hypothetical protein